MFGKASRNKLLALEHIYARAASSSILISSLLVGLR